MPEGSDVATLGKSRRSNTATTMVRRFENEVVNTAAPYELTPDMDPLNVVRETQE